MTAAMQTMLLAAGVWLVLCGLGVVAMLRVQSAAKRIAARIGATVGPHRPARPQAERPAPSRRSGASRLETLFGCTPSRRAASGLRWWIVLPAALLLARALAGVLAALLTPPAIWATPIFWLMLSRAWWRRCEMRRRAALYRQFPDALAMIVRGVRVGIPVTETIRGVAREAVEPTAGEFAQLADQLAVGMPIDAAVQVMAQRSGMAEYRFFATALSLQSQTGGGLTETLENLADVIRRRLALRARGVALAAEARTSAAVLAVLPVLTVAALFVASPEYVSVLIDEPGGRRILAGAAFMLGLGMLTMRGLIRASLS